MFPYIIRKIIAPAWAMHERSDYLSNLAMLHRTPYRNRASIESEQLNLLKDIVEHAFNTTQFYNSTFRSSGFHPSQIQSLDDLKHLPILSKDDIRNNYKSLRSKIHGKRDVREKFTSGSTGIPLTVAVDEECMQYKRACTLRHDMWTGWKIGEPAGIFWGEQDPKPKSLRQLIRNHFLERKIYINTLQMSESSMRLFANMILEKKPTMLLGHAHSLYLFAEFCESSRITLPPLKGVISAAMVLHDFERDKIEKVFGTRVFNRYGCEEVSLIASECGSCPGLHINEDALLVECVDVNGTPVQDGNPGAVLVTDLRNRAMPILRYKIGDVATVSVEKNECRINYKKLSNINGRIADYLCTPEGKFISGISLTDNFTMHLHEIKQIQIVQNKIDHILFRVVIGSPWTEDTTMRLSALVDKFFGNDMNHDVVFVDSIQSEKSGKYRFCISEINKRPF